MIISEETLNKHIRNIKYLKEVFMMTYYSLEDESLKQFNEELIDLESKLISILSDFNNHKLGMPEIFLVDNSIFFDTDEDVLLFLEIIKRNVNNMKNINIDEFYNFNYNKIAFDCFKKLITLEREMVSLLDSEYRIIDKDKFIRIYKKYLDLSIKVINSDMKNHDNSDYINQKVSVVRKYSSNRKYPYPKEKKEIREYKPSIGKVYTEENIINKYINGGFIIKMCLPIYFNNLLNNSKYSINARYSLLHQMYRRVAISTYEEQEALILDYLGIVSSKLEDKYRVILDNRDIFLESISDIKSVLFPLEENINDFTLEEIEEYISDEVNTMYSRIDKSLKQV